MSCSLLPILVGWLVRGALKSDFLLFFMLFPECSDFLAVFPLLFPLDDPANDLLWAGAAFRGVRWCDLPFTRVSYGLVMCFLEWMFLKISFCLGVGNSRSSGLGIFLKMGLFLNVCSSYGILAAYVGYEVLAFNALIGFI
jgi:hypothetical protein